MDILKRNLFRLLRSGALNKFEVIEPMSVFKWNKLIQISIAQNLTSILIKGIKNNQYEGKIDIPKSVIDSLTEIESTASEPLYAPQLSNRLLNNRLLNIQKSELHAIDTSIHTLELLNIIVSNVHETLNNGLYMRRILDLGRYLRTQGDKVDFVKLDTWLNRLHISRMAQLQGSILIKVFNFEKDEIPFVVKIEPSATKLVNHTTDYTTINSTQDWNFKQSKTGFVTSNSPALRRNIRRAIKYFNYAPIETMSNIFGNFAHSLTQIEE